MEEIREERLRGNLVRSGAQYVDMNENPSKFFLNLENKKCVSKNVRELKNADLTIQKPDEILQEMYCFYQRLYTSKMMILVPSEHGNIHGIFKECCVEH